MSHHDAVQQISQYACLKYLLTRELHQFKAKLPAKHTLHEQREELKRDSLDASLFKASWIASDSEWGRMAELAVGNCLTWKTVRQNASRPAGESTAAVRGENIFQSS
jgi:hypothetical protein